MNKQISFVCLGASIITIIGFVGALTTVILNTQQTLAITRGGNAGQGWSGGGSSGATIGGGNAGQSVDRNLFCNTGIMTPVCK
jgi:hypothetical protein